MSHAGAGGQAERRGPWAPALLATGLLLWLCGCGGSDPRPVQPTVQPHKEVAQPHAPSPRFVSDGRPVYCGGKRPYAALTFDDGPGVYTSLALRILRKAHVRGTFFLVGRNLSRFRGQARADAKAGALGNHTWSHPFLPALPPAAIGSEIARTDAGVRQLTGVRPRLFRPPYEGRNAAVDAAARRNRLTEILWNVDSRDSLGANYASIARNVLAGIGPGAIVLLHENRGQTIRALKFNILPALRRRRLHLVTVPQLLALDPPSAQQLRKGPLGCATHATLPGRSGG